MSRIKCKLEQLYQHHPSIIDTVIQIVPLYTIKYMYHTIYYNIRCTIVPILNRNELFLTFIQF